MKKTATVFIVAVLAGGGVLRADAAVYLVGPSRAYAVLQDVAGLLREGDTVKVDGNATYPADVYLTRSGNPGSWITVIGVRQGGGGTLPVVCCSL